MNIAFPALVILLLILPGAIFRYAYARGSWGWSSPISFRTVSDELAYSTVFAVGLHFVWVAIASYFGNEPDFHALVALLTGNFGIGRETYDHAIDAIALHVVAIFTYFMTLFLFSAAAGRGAHRAVRYFKLDLRTEIFRFRNEWHYLLTGEILSFSEVEIEARELSGVFLSAAVDYGRETYLYRGIVVDWSFAEDGQPETIRLRFTHRRKLSDDRTTDDQSKQGTRVSGDFILPDERYYEVHGDIFVLRYSQLKTLNLDYFYVSEVPTSGGSAVIEQTAP